MKMADILSNDAYTIPSGYCIAFDHSPLSKNLCFMQERSTISALPPPLLPFFINLHGIGQHSSAVYVGVEVVV